MGLSIKARRKDEEGDYKEDSNGIHGLYSCHLHTRSDIYDERMRVSGVETSEDRGGKTYDHLTRFDGRVGECSCGVVAVSE